MEGVLLGLADDRELTTFSCCTQGDADYHVEVETYVQALVLRRAQHVIGLRSAEGELVGVGAFDPVIASNLPLVLPEQTRAWHLKVIAVASDHQRQGVSRELIDHAFATMRTLDRTRSLIFARVHEENSASLRACANAGIECYQGPDSDCHFDLIGSVPGTTPPVWYGE